MFLTNDDEKFAPANSIHFLSTTGRPYATYMTFLFRRLWSCTSTRRKIKNNPWVTVNNDFLVTSEVKIMGKSPHEWPKKSLFMVTNMLFYFLHAISCTEHTFRYKQSSIAYFAIAAKDGLFWINIVTSSQLICDVMRKWRHIRRLFLHAQNWRKDDLHKWITTVNIDFSRPSIHGLPCKKNNIWMCQECCHVYIHTQKNQLCPLTKRVSNN